MGLKNIIEVKTLIINQNSDFLFGFEAVLTNPNGDPDQENKPRMDYETSTALVSDARRKRDCREFLKRKGYRIFVDTLAEQKVPMDKMFAAIRDEWLGNPERFRGLLEESPELHKKWKTLAPGSDISERTDFADTHQKLMKEQKKKSEISDFNNSFLTMVIQKSLIDIRLFGSAMAVEGVSRTYTGPVQITWGYSLHPVELLKSNTITSIMNEDNSTFGKKYKLHYALVAHYGTINKYSANLTGMTEEDRILFRQALVQGLMGNQTDSKQGQTPLFYLEIIYKNDFDGYLGDLRRFLSVKGVESERPVRALNDLRVDFYELKKIISQMKEKELIDKVVGWLHPFAIRDTVLNIPLFEEVDLWAPVANLQEG